jgi:oxygen-dependent protoporphyrinogen oxidase
MSRPRVVVVGAGVAGLSAAFRLQQQGCIVTVLEAEDHVGGKTASIRRDGFVLNTGATVLAGSYAAMRTLAEEAGLDPDRSEPPADHPVGADRRWDGAARVARYGQLRAPTVARIGAGG